MGSMAAVTALLAMIAMATLPAAQALNNGVGLTPAMGWNR